MAFDLCKGVTTPRDWSRSNGNIGSVGEDADAELPTFTTAADTNRIVNKVVEEEQRAVEEMSQVREKIDPAVWQTFQRYHNDFHTWLASTGKRPYGSLKLGTHGIHTTAFEYRKSVKDWRELAAKAGASRIGPKTRGVDETPSESTSMWAWVAAALGGAVVATVVARKVGF